MKIILSFFMHLVDKRDVSGRKIRSFYILSSRCQYCPSQLSQWMFGEICSTGRFGKVSQTKYGHSGCAFFPLFVHRLDLEVCSDSHLDVQVRNDSSQSCTLGYSLAMNTEGSVVLLRIRRSNFCWSSTDSKAGLIISFFHSDDSVLHSEVDPLSLSGAYGGRASKGWLEVASTIH